MLKSRPANGTYSTLLAFILGLMSKPMLVTLPFVFLLMDFWPLGRIRLAGPAVSSEVVKGRWKVPPGAGTARVLLEKIPFFMLSAAAAILPSMMARGYQTTISLERVSMPLRLANATVAYVKYIGKMIWPHDFAILYPFPASVPSWKVWLAGFFLLTVTGLALANLKSKPYLGFGWFWYLGTLVPVIGLIQVGLWPAMADRWAYVPLIGLYIVIAWGMADLLPDRRRAELSFSFLAILAFVGLALLTRAQVRHWSDSRALFEHTLAVTRQNVTIHNNLGVALQRAGRFSGRHRTLSGRPCNYARRRRCPDKLGKCPGGTEKISCCHRKISKGASHPAELCQSAL